ncbi:MAG: rare lipoprotein [Candidatus Acidoferrum typicum]|nr:rare lipoprotein [Candidatus Acidoferrum typicum]
MILGQSAGAADDLQITRQQLRFFCGFCALCIGFISGCGSRHTTASRPEPAQPESSETSDNGEQPRKTERGSGPGANATRRTTPVTAAKRDIPAPNPAMAAYTEQGNASWYGIPFDGRRASNGEIYDMHKLTAAHRTLPFDTVVRVTNLSNGKSTVVRITDRGPFVDNRIIDLSMAAAREIDSIGPGVVPVRLEILSAGIDPTSGFFTVQVGAFRERGNAERLRERLNASYSPIFVQPYDSPEGLFYRVRVGKVTGEDAAQHFGEQLRNREGFNPMVVRLDDGLSSGGTNER